MHDDIQQVGDSSSMQDGLSLRGTPHLSQAGLGSSCPDLALEISAIDHAAAILTVPSSSSMCSSTAARCSGYSCNSRFATALSLSSSSDSECIAMMSCRRLRLAGGGG